MRSSVKDGLYELSMMPSQVIGDHTVTFYKDRWPLVVTNRDEARRFLVDSLIALYKAEDEDKAAFR